MKSSSPSPTPRTLPLLGLCPKKISQKPLSFPFPDSGIWPGVKLSGTASTITCSCLYGCKGERRMGVRKKIQNGTLTPKGFILKRSFSYHPRIQMAFIFLFFFSSRISPCACTAQRCSHLPPQSPLRPRHTTDTIRRHHRLLGTGRSPSRGRRLHRDNLVAESPSTRRHRRSTGPVAARRGSSAHHPRARARSRKRHRRGCHD